VRRAAIALAGLLVFAACGEEAPAVPERPTATPTMPSGVSTGTRQVTDMQARSISVPDTVTKVSVLSPSAAEYARALGLEIVARTSDVPEAIAPGAKATGTTLSPDFNAVAAVSPELVIADAAYHGSRTRDFDRFTYPVFIVRTASYLDVLAALRSLGAATGHDEEAAAAIAALEAKAEALVQRAKARGTPPSVLILTGGGRDVFGGSTQTYLGSLVAFLGGTNVLGAAAEGGPIPGFGVVDVGQSAALNPEVVLILPSGTADLSAQIEASSAWAATSAVRADRIHELDVALFLRSPGPNAGAALEALFDLLFPG